eukprot:TRINITY_DN3328_c0_g1_i1.p1 TRINITY_DN3328_c0_g1~~TRINITY_DN3328_c0_g1_i1.p1  ORF type:complete len:225 (+),score=27.45 TRINITY_DN3328_c0_g1_i1:72-746(+)
MMFVLALALLVTQVLANDQVLRENIFEVGSTSDSNLPLYVFNVTDPVEVQFIRTSVFKTFERNVGIYLTYGKPTNEHDTSPFMSGHIKLTNSPQPGISSLPLQPGTWYVEIIASGNYSYALRYCNDSCEEICPYECNRHGACNMTTTTCTCDSYVKLFYQDQHSCLPVSDRLIWGLPLISLIAVGSALFVLLIVMPFVGYCCFKHERSRVSQDGSGSENSLVDL